MGDVTACGGCGAAGFKLLLDMGLQPLAEGRAGKRYPLLLVRCENCLLVQLDYAVDPAEVFPPDHPYTTGNSAALKRHYEDLARELAGPLHTGDVVVDIGANDGTLLNCYPPGKGNLVKVAVEPTDQGKKIPAGITWEKGFFTEELAGKIREAHGPAKVVTACNVLAHVPDPHEFTDGVRELLADDGVFVTENHDLASILDGLQVDTVYHEHLRYYTPGTLARLLEEHGLRVERVILVPTHGGSFRTYARKGKENFTGRANAAATALRGMLWDISFAKRQQVYGIGAATRATPLIHWAGIRGFITCVCEVPGSDKTGTRMPGTTIPVVDESALVSNQPEYALLFAWHMKDIIVPKLRKAGYKGKFIVPLPEPRVLDA